MRAIAAFVFSVVFVPVAAGQTNPFRTNVALAIGGGVADVDLPGQSTGADWVRIRHISAYCLLEDSSATSRIIIRLTNSSPPGDVLAFEAPFVGADTKTGSPAAYFVANLNLDYVLPETIVRVRADATNAVVGKCDMSLFGERTPR